MSWGCSTDNLEKHFSGGKYLIVDFELKKKSSVYDVLLSEKSYISFAKYFKAEMH